MNDASATRLGAFVLEERIAYGGMGEIWRGVHLRSGTPVAIKVMTGGYVHEPMYREVFRSEVEAVASLHHPNVTIVFDYGVIPESVAAATDGELLAGSPYLVMEYASRGSLDRLRLPLHWHDFERITRALLQALGHAHARGIIHRDIKPGNVLLGSSDDPRPHLKLTDFGIAHALGRHLPSHADASPHGTVEDVLGTPWYMAPEQLTGHWRDYGPWTDLYAFGIVAWELATGDVPFDGENAFDIGMSHLEEPLPPFQPRMPAPKELEGWLQKLLAKEHRDRFQCAADALAAFDALPRPEVDQSGAVLNGTPPTTEPPVRESSAPTVSDVPLVERTTMLQPLNGVAEAGDAASSVLHAMPTPPVPADWRTMEPRPEVNELIGSGLGLYAMRHPPFIGRERERDTLWAALRHMQETRQPVGIVVRGPAGIGKTRLANWVAERAEECGAARVLRARNEAEGGPRSGLPRMLAEAFRLIGLGEEELRHRVRQLMAQLGVYDPLFAEEIIGFVADAVESPADQRAKRFEGRAMDRQRLVARVLEALAKERPLVVIVDDVHHEPDTLGLLDGLLSAEDYALPVLFVVTGRDDTQEDEGPMQLSSFAGREDVVELRVGPLRPTDTESLLRELLPMAQRLRTNVAQRVDGNPLFATQLVGDWVEQERLMETTGGYDLIDDGSYALPDSIFGTWTARIEGVVEGDHDAIAIELAALLGREFSTTELSLATERYGAPMATDFIARLVRSRLCEATDSGWAFRHAMLRETIMRRAKEGARWEALHRACASAMGADEQQPDRRARHLIEAGAWSEASGAILLAARVAHRRGEPAQALAWLEQHERALEAAAIDARDARRADATSLRANVLLRLGRRDEAERCARDVVESPYVDTWPRASADADDALAFISRQRGEMKEARAFSLRALQRFEVLGDAAGQARVLLNLGYTSLGEQRFNAALASFERAGRFFEHAQDEGGVARALLASGRARLEVGALDEGRRDLLAAREMFDQLGQGALAREVDRTLDETAEARHAS